MQTTLYPVRTHSCASKFGLELVFVTIVHAANIRVVTPYAQAAFNRLSHYFDRSQISIARIATENAPALKNSHPTI